MKRVIRAILSTAWANNKIVLAGLFILDISFNVSFASPRLAARAITRITKDTKNIAKETQYAFFIKPLSLFCSRRGR
jgi:hypothetical protein